MCGIIGYWPAESYDPMDVKERVNDLFWQSRARGTHAAGFSVLRPLELVTRVSSNPEELLDTLWSLWVPSYPLIMHTRYSQSGDWREMRNNQPIHDGKRLDDGARLEISVAMNGVIHMGTKEEFEQAFNVQCASYNDADVFVQRVLEGQPAEDFIKELSGSFAGVWFERRTAEKTIQTGMRAMRNTRRPMWASNEQGMWVASTYDIFRRSSFNAIAQVPPDTLVSLGEWTVPA